MSEFMELTKSLEKSEIEFHAWNTKKPEKLLLKVVEIEEKNVICELFDREKKRPIGLRRVYLAKSLQTQFERLEAKKDDIIAIDYLGGKSSEYAPDEFNHQFVCKKPVKTKDGLVWKTSKTYKA